MSEPGFYSECGEDKWICDNLQLSQNGFFVDVGCWQPEAYSQTAFLRDKGWRGLAIDANPEHAKCWAEHNKCKGTRFVSAVLSPNPKVRFVSHKNSMCSRVTGIGEKAPGDSTEAIVTAVTLEKILSENHIGTFDFLSLDVEGHEFDVFNSMDWEKHKPRIIVAEYSTQLMEDDFRLRDLLTAQYGYRVAFQTVSNFVFTL